ncbi:MAG: hypothetical protein NC911_05630 [Candidatus Omnitrophica bacterium]|nr:hypothetical protein [Candidatus Omnitrophota bacterium]
MAEKQLRPAYLKGQWEKDVLAYYQDKKGNLYRLVERSGHILFDKAGKEVYRKTRGLSKVKTSLTIRGWPARNEEGPIGLDPAWEYCLLPGPREETLLRIEGLTEGVYGRGYREGNGFIVLSLGRTGLADALEEARIEYFLPAKAAKILVNGKEVQAKKRDNLWLLQVPPESTIVFLTGETTKIAADGLLGSNNDQGYIIPCRGPELVLEMSRGKLLQIPFKVPGEEKSLAGYLAATPDGVRLVFDYVVEVPDRDSSLRFYGQHVPQKYGDGQKVFLWSNGALVLETSLSRDDEKIHCWEVPLGQFAGQPVLITLASDPNQNSNCDNMRLSRLYVVSDPKITQPRHHLF